MIVFSKASPFLLAKKIETATKTPVKSPYGKAFQSIEKENIRNDTENLPPCQWDSYALPLSF